jgi:hypothetical protein
VEERDQERVWRIWVNTELRVVSFHEEDGWQRLEFRDRELYRACLDRYTAQRYHYQ